ncbi:hypothetical protein, partial [Lysinibacillus fusiformis]|uniref:hypothetical protein n=1 Tax=Lysinibacillus fusiformis TaxID=28031 RepID=UPI0020BDE82D
ASTNSPLQIATIQPSPQQTIRENLNINMPEITSPVNNIEQEQDNIQVKESASKQPRELFESLEAGDENKLKGTRADPTYT